MITVTTVDSDQVTVLFEGVIRDTPSLVHVRVTARPRRMYDGVHYLDALEVECRGELDTLGNYNWTRLPKTDPTYMVAITTVLWGLLKEATKTAAPGPDIDGLSPAKVATMFGATLFAGGK